MTSIASDDTSYVAFQHGAVTRIYNASGKVVSRVDGGCSVQDLVDGDALVSCNGDRLTGAEIVDLATRKVFELPSRLSVRELGRYWVLAQREVPYDPSQVRGPEAQWVWINRRTRRIVPAGEPFSRVGLGGDSPPAHERLNSPTLALPADPAWIPASSVVVDRRGQQALGYAVSPATGGTGALELFRPGKPARQLSDCRGSCGSAAFGGGIASWLQQAAGRLTARVFDGRRVYTLRSSVLRDAVIKDVAHVRGRVFVAAQLPGSAAITLHSFAVSSSGP